MKKIIPFLMTALVASVLIAGCNNAEKSAAKNESTAPAFDLSTAKKEIEAANRNFMEMLAKGDSAGIANAYTADARLMFSGMPPAVGRASIQSVFSGIINSGVTKVDIKTTEVFGTEELLAEEGMVIIYVKEKAVAEEKYIVLWKKEDGKWKLFRDITNSNSPDSH